MPHELERFHQLLVTFSRDHGDAIAVQGATERFTYRQLLAEVGLRTHGLRTCSPGPLVLALDSSPQLVFWDLAALFAERPCVIVPSFFSVAQFSHCIEQSGASHVLSFDLQHGQQIDGITILNPLQATPADLALAD